MFFISLLANEMLQKKNAVLDSLEKEALILKLLATVRDPPIEKAESAQNHTIPEIQINGPSNSPSKENGLTSSPNQHTTPSSKEFSPDSTQQNGIEDHPSETDDAAEPPKEVTPPPPMFPHVSPFKPQFDFKRDVTLSPRASSYFEVNGVVMEDGSVLSTPDKEGDKGQFPPGHDDMGMSVGEMDGKDVQQPESPAKDESTNQNYPDENSSAPKADEESDVPTTTTPRSADASQPTHRPPSPPPTNDAAPDAEANCEEKPLLLDDVNVDVQEDAGAQVTAATTVTTDEEMATAPLDSSSEPAATESQPPPPQVEDRSAILASFFDHQDGPEVLGSDEEDSPFPTRPEHDPEFLANQVEDDAMELSKAKTPPLLSNEGGRSSEGAAGDATNVLKRHRAATAGAGGNGDVDPAFSAEEKAKLNELLNEIEAIAEKQNLFENAP